jgi:branched-chain amino acid transport system substrate-binding protein
MSNTTKWITGLIVVALIIAGVVSTAGNTSSNETDNSIKVSAILSLSGEGAAYAESMRRGIRLAADEVDVEVSFADTAGKPTSGASAYKQVKNQGADVIIGPVFSSVGQAVGPIAQKDETILLATAVSSQKVTDIGEHIFSLYPTGDAEGGAIVDYALDNTNTKRFGIVNSQEDVHVDIANTAAGKLREAGVDVAFQETLSPDTQDFRTVIAKLENANNPESVLVLGKKKFTANFISQAKELGLASDFYSYAEMYDESLLDTYGESLNGLTITAPYFDAKSQDSQIASFRDKFEKRFKQPLDVWAAYGYDAVMTLDRARQNCSDCDTSDLAKAIKSLSFDGVTGPIRFNENGHADKAFRIFQVQNQEFVEVGTSE